MQETSLGGENIRFQPTPWTMVLTGDSHALEHLAKIYWKPLYFFLRRKGIAVEEAKDLTQEFWATLLERSTVAKATPERGRFRTFLLASLGNFVRDQARGEGRIKRGGGRKVLSFDFDAAETHYTLEPVADETPESVFQRRWARSLLQTAVGELTSPYLDAVKLHLAGEKGIAAKLGVSEQDAKNYVHRGRMRLRQLLIARIRETVDDPTQLQTEISEFISSIH